ncbi:MAG TPA: membrane-bound PQQ-dependent dehydrogenase, glucose/quinate/shikimate family [Modicisalibacter sp.]|nr:membrane-bound PQQ-dependent dehydrogenase, glucose/quinate/shikimate family [Modicisalibacter sp.]
MAASRDMGRTGHWLLVIFGVIVLLLGLALIYGGVQLIGLGGSWYYLLAGIGLSASGIQLARGLMSGAWLYGVVFLGTFFWSLWEVGLNYWGWLPRLGLIGVLAFFLTLLLPLLKNPPAKKISRSLAGLCVLAFIGFFALAFVPQGVTQANWDIAEATPSPPSISPLPLIGGDTVQAANAPAEGDWPAYGRSNAAMRYSPLTQITPDNVANLERAWVYRTGDLPPNWGAETTPIEVDGTMYLCSATNDLIALDASTGEELWRFDHDYPSTYIPYTAACRTVAYYEVPVAETDIDGGEILDTGVDEDSALCSTRIIEGTLDHRLIAVDAKTGKPCLEFGDNGQVDISLAMGEVKPGRVAKSSVTIVRGVIVSGHQVLDGIELSSPSGVIRGYDAVTGDLLWAWDMMQPEIEAWPPEGEIYFRGTPNMWTIASADEELGLVYLPMGNPTVDFLSESRYPPENEYSTSLVAIDVTTGEPVWHFQTVHKDVWDYDLGSTGTLVDFPTDDGLVPAIILSTKQGDVYVLNRRTGELLVGVEERPVPEGGVEPQERADTQPFSLYHTFRQEPLVESDMWGLTPIDQMICRIEFQKASYAGIYTPPTAGTPYIQYPGYNGGTDWGGIAVDPERGVIIANYNDIAMYNELIPRERIANPANLHIGSQPLFGTPYAIEIRAGWRMPWTGLPCKKPPYGGIRAIDLASGETIWDRPFGTARANGPFGIATHLPILIGTPNNGGPAVTASGLVFIAAATDNLIRAIDMRTGETVWKDVLPAGGQATPLVYEADGRQYMVIMAGGHHFMETPIGDYVIAYALPE